MTREELETKYERNLERCFDFSPPEGWLDLIDRTLAKLVLLNPNIQVAQVKSKFGQCDMHVDYNCYTDSVRAVLSHVNQASRTICEDCGAPGRTREPRGRWLVTCCDGCAKRRASSV